jgi:pyrimidine operon attenuation protein/uracil phosphoribosyltransferase
VTSREKAQVLDDTALDRALTRIAHEIVEQAGGERVALVGIKTRGVTLAERIAEKIAGIEGTRPPVGALDNTLYRDDLRLKAEQPAVRGTEILPARTTSSSWTTSSSPAGRSGRPWTRSWTWAARV